MLLVVCVSFLDNQTLKTLPSSVILTAPTSGLSEVGAISHMSMYHHISTVHIFYIYIFQFIYVSGGIVIPGGVVIGGFNINFGFLGTQTIIVTITTTTTIIGGVIAIPTPIGPAMQLVRGDQCISIESAADQTCMHNPDLCTDGFTVVWTIMFREFHDAVFISNTGGPDGVGFSLFYKQRALRAVMKTQSTVWYVALPDLQVNTWYNVELAWSVTDGLKIHANNLLLGENTHVRERDEDPTRLITGPINIGRYNNTFKIFINLQTD